MPSWTDNTYHREFSKPTYDTEKDKLRQQLTREADEIFEARIPRLPTREEEIAYMKW